MGRLICCLMLLVLSSGCGSSQKYVVHQPVNLGGSARDGGSVLVECDGLPEPTDVVGHYISIDEGEPIYVEAFSQLNVALAAGTHTVNIVSVGVHNKSAYKAGQPPDKNQTYPYGKASLGSFVVIERGAAVVRYQAPSGANDAGQLSVL